MTDCRCLPCQRDPTRIPLAGTTWGDMCVVDTKAPDHYRPLPDYVRCRCPNQVMTADGQLWCCEPARADGDRT